MSTHTTIKSYWPEAQRPSFTFFVEQELEALAEDSVTLFERTEAGLDVKYLKAILTELELTAAELACLLGVSPSTLTRRIAAGKKEAQTLSPAESDRIFTILRVYRKAIALFEGDQDKARRWMRRPVRGLGNHVPIDMLVTETGAHAVEQLIGRLEHGVFS